ncbi:MAG: hypothetical protein V2J89_15095, partial [Halieaceae bacterium]|nr:hypothetical protein [Halieaceae bacterium]
MASDSALARDTGDGADSAPTAIEQVMRRRDTWRGQDISAAAKDGLATGYTQMDQALRGGGWPLGQTIELLSD